MKWNKGRAPIVVCLVLAALLSACAPGGGPSGGAGTVSSDSLYVERVEDLPADFILGMDASCVPALERSGVSYRDHDGVEKDVYQILSENGINYIRVRVWNDPFDAQGNGYGGGNCDIENAIEVGRRATEHGMKLLVDFHYSDFWADPAKQMVPKAWEGLDIDQKCEALYGYTRDCLLRLIDAGVDVGMVQLGNETNGAMCGETSSALGGWKRIMQLMSAGSRAVREVCPEALVAVHFTNPERPETYESYGKNLEYYQVDYDVFASSYYPYWHGTLENLAQVLSGIAETYGKKVMVAETSYAFTAEDSDFSGNTIGDGGGIVKDYPFTVQGQANLIRDVIDTVANRTTNGIGVFYWEGTWISVGGGSYEENSALWEAHGSGWASSYAAQYDPEDAGRWYGGCAVDNQALFDPEGRATEALKVFALVRSGNAVENAVDAIEDVALVCDLGGEIVLPETVDAVLRDGSRQAVPVLWEEADLEGMRNGGVADYVVEGTADGTAVRCYISMVRRDYLTNGSFEEGETGWTAEILGDMDELFVEDKVSDSLTGTRHYHFWSAAAGTVAFTLEQEVQGLGSGRYDYSISIMGGSGGETEIYAYVKIGGEMVHTAQGRITVYDEWHTMTIGGIEYAAGESIAVGIYVSCAGPGAWGKIDDAALHLADEG